jgi:DNA-binding NtrC family response regulator
MKKRCVLVLETDPVARRHLTSLLETWGYEPVVAGSVDESLAVVAHSHFLFRLLGLDLDGDARPVPAVKPGTVSLKIVGRKAAQAAEREAILRALDQTRWNRFQAAKLLNISYRALLYKIKDAGLEPDRRAASET